jgi:uncharacterized protein YjbI with pentapeptide repeats
MNSKKSLLTIVLLSSTSTLALAGTDVAKMTKDVKMIAGVVYPTYKNDFPGAVNQQLYVTSGIATTPAQIAALKVDLAAGYQAAIDNYNAHKDVYLASADGPSIVALLSKALDGTTPLNAALASDMLKDAFNVVLAEDGTTREKFDFSNLDTTGVDLSNQDLRNTGLTTSQIEKASSVAGADLAGLDLTGIDLSNKDLTGTDFYQTTLVGANLSNQILSDANFFGADLKNADLRNTDLQGANLRYADVTGAITDGANFSQAKLFSLNYGAGWTPPIVGPLPPPDWTQPDPSCDASIYSH